MEVFIFRETPFRKRLSRLYRAGGKECQVAGRVDRIIERLCKRSAATEGFGKTTKNGEARVNKCRKLDLGGGYRLLYLTGGPRFIFLFVGAHDACDRWLKRKTGFEVLEETSLSKVSSRPEADSDCSREEPRVEEESDCEDLPMMKIDDRILRRIFRGLSGEKEF